MEIELDVRGFVGVKAAEATQASRWDVNLEALLMLKPEYMAEQQADDAGMGDDEDMLLRTGFKQGFPAL